MPTKLLLRSIRTTSRQCPSMQPKRSRVPTVRNPARLHSAMLAVFSGKMPACSVQMPACSEAEISADKSAGPIPLPCVPSAT